MYALTNNNVTRLKKVGGKLEGSAAFKSGASFEDWRRAMGLVDGIWIGLGFKTHTSILFVRID